MKATSAAPAEAPLTKRASRSWCFFVDLILGGHHLDAWTFGKGMDSWEVEGVNDDSSEEDEESGEDEESMAMDMPRGGTPRSA